MCRIVDVAFKAFALEHDPALVLAEKFTFFE